MWRTIREAITSTGNTVRLIAVLVVLALVAAFLGHLLAAPLAHPLDHPEWAAEMLSTLFEAARVHGTTIQVQAQPAGQGSPSRQAT